MNGLLPTVVLIITLVHALSWDLTIIIIQECSEYEITGGITIVLDPTVKDRKD